ncbi:MAG TPA: tetratricopeptide repeat protein [Candidatus Polarisedimenticolaceae bacterium]|nr:tetratricopeptide repeat protein [Candidatus Polarisedimenticolaceae bacterium]
MTRTLIVLAAVASLLGGEAHRRTEKGNELYKEGSLDRALEEYGRAQALVPMAPELPYDLGNVLYRQENWAGAAEAYEKALGSAGRGLAPSAAYNLGNALFKDEKYDDAIKAYVRALKTAPSDADAKRNLELALRALQQQKQQQQQQQQKPQGQPKDDDKKEPPKSGTPKDEEKKDDKQQKQQQGSMSPEEAEKLLDRVGEQEKQNLKREKGRRAPAADARGKDW